MAIKIRCPECSKKISIDEAFAGGMCRCPYCKALALVPDESGQPAQGVRPEAPGGRPEEPAGRPAEPGGRPEEPGGAPAGPTGPAIGEHEHIPMARPVKVQGIITIVLLILLALMVAVGMTLALMYLPSGGPKLPPEGPPQVDPLAVSKSGPAIADIKDIKAPIVYVIDGGSSMRGTFDAARVMASNSIQSLTGGGQFTAIIAREDEDRAMGEEFVPGGESGKEKFESFVKATVPTGATDIARSLTAALERNPGTIVLIARKPVGGAMAAAAKAKEQGVPIVAITIDGDPEVNMSMEKLAETSGGQFRKFFTAEF